MLLFLLLLLIKLFRQTIIFSIISFLFNFSEISHIFENKFKINSVLFSKKEPGREIIDGKRNFDMNKNSF